MKWVALVLIALMAAGCLSGPSRPDYAKVQTEVAAAALPSLELEHAEANGHYLARDHQAAFNLALVGYSNGIDQGTPAAIPTLGSYTELAVGHDGFAYLARTSKASSPTSTDGGSFGGLSIIDVSNPAAPVIAGHYDGLPAVDVEVDPEGHYAYLATQRTTADSLNVLQRTQNPLNALPRGIDILDVSDKRHPALVSFVPLPVNGPHTLTYVRHPNGDDYLLVCTYDLVTDPQTNTIAGVVPVTQRLLVFLVEPNPTGQGPGVGLLPVAQYQYIAPSPPGAGQPLVFPHDARAGPDPTDPSRFLITVAYWDAGVRILDFTHPPSSAVPPTDQAESPVLKEVGTFDNFYPSAYNNIHLAMAFPEKIAGRAITVAQPEIIDAPDETGQVSILDTSDPANPQIIGHWSLNSIAPDLGVRNLDFSPHNFDLWDGKIALGHYHAGVWVLDVHDEENLKEPKPVAVYMPNKERPNSPVMQPDVWGVVQSNGLLYVSDKATGLYILRYTGP